MNIDPKNDDAQNDLTRVKKREYAMQNEKVSLRSIFQLTAELAAQLVFHELSTKIDLANKPHFPRAQWWLVRGGHT